MFVQSVKAIKQLIHEEGESNGKIINNRKVVVKDVREVSYGVEADIEISKGRTKGLARIKIWGPSKSAKGNKNKCTIIVTKYPHSDGKYVTLLSKKVVKPLLDLYLKGEGWKSLVTKIKNASKDRIQCTKCDKPFGKAKMHDSRFNICDKKFEGVDALKIHKTETHSQAAIDIVKEVTQENEESNVGENQEIKAN